jgi:cytochrome c peroxidase
MHDGRFATLDAVIEPGPNRSPLLKGFSITPEEKCDLIAFLESLTDEEFLRDPRHADPWPAGR